MIFDNAILVLTFILPIAIVIAMHYAKLVGIKTNVQAILVLLVALNQTNWGFIPANDAAALLAGVSIAIVLARSYTKKGV